MISRSWTTLQARGRIPKVALAEAVGLSAIFHAESHRVNLVTMTGFYVAASRGQFRAMLVTDNTEDLTEALREPARAGQKVAALDESRELASTAEKAAHAMGAVRVPSAKMAESQQLASKGLDRTLDLSR